MSRHPNLKEGEPQCFPRVSGDEPLWGDLVKSYNLFSPRERG